MNLDSGKSPEKLAVLVVGSDTLIEALPARPMQLAHACGALGFDLAIPLSWGDELVAEAALQLANSRGQKPAVLCSCPLVRQRLLHSGADLAASMISLISPPVAVARYLRGAMGDRLGSLSFAGACPDAVPPEYDVSYKPSEFLALVRSRGIQIQQQPDVFYDRFPPDRRRFASLPGGCPDPELLWQRCNGAGLVEVEGADLAVQIAQFLMSPQAVLVDAAAAVGCSCSGVTPSTASSSARIAVTSLEPPRSVSPVISAPLLDLTLAVPVPIPPSLGASQGADRPGLPPMAKTPPTALRARKQEQ